MPRVYLDWNATAPLSSAARAAWLAAQDEAWANPSSVHREGQRARHHLDQAKLSIGKILGARAHELVLTSGGTEANATAIHAAISHAGAGVIAASTIEHSSVLRNAQAHADCTLKLLPVDAHGVLSPATVASAIDADTRLLCVQFANNELGTMPPVAAIVAAAKAANPGCLVLLDACQGAGKAALDLTALGVDFAVVAGHKLGAPKGVGLLYVRNGVRVPALLCGGRQQQDRRSGTEDPALAAAFAAALADVDAHRETETVRQRALLDELWATLLSALPAVQWLAHGAPRLSNTISLAHPGVRNEPLVARLDLAGFAVSTGAACMAARGEPSHVVAALGIVPNLARSVVRVSIGPATTAAELAAFEGAYVREVNALLAAGVRC